MKKKKRKSAGTAPAPAEQKKTNHLHILMVSAVLTLSTLFVVAGIGVVGIQGNRNGVDPDNPPASFRQQEELLYQISLLGETAVIDLAPLNQAVGFFHRNTFLIPAPLLFLRQVSSAVYLAYTDGETFEDLVLFP